jgi:Branched-chain amino acid transport system / permease component
MSTATAPTGTTPRSWSLIEMGWPRPQWVVLTVGLLAAVVLPFAVPDSSWLVIATLGAIWLTLNQSWNLVLGFSGVWHFGQLAVYAIGAYVAALLSLHTGLPAVATVLLGGVAALLVSVLLALPSLRLRGIYVALLTFGFGEVIRLLIISDQTRFTGGSFGLSGYRGFGFDGMDGIAKDRASYWIALGVAVTAGQRAGGTAGQLPAGGRPRDQPEDLSDGRVRPVGVLRRHRRIAVRVRVRRGVSQPDGPGADDTSGDHAGGRRPRNGDRSDRRDRDHDVRAGEVAELARHPAHRARPDPASDDRRRAAGPRPRRGRMETAPGQLDGRGRRRERRTPGRGRG